MSVKVSIVVPIFNVESYLDKCLKSLVDQSLQEIEIICVNDSSPDNSDKIIKKYAEADSRIIYIKNETNKKTAFCRNAGINAASGEFIGFVDGDDYVDLDFFEKLYNLAMENHADIAKGNVRIVDSCNNIVSRHCTDNDSIDENKFAFYGSMWDAIYKRNMIVNNSISFSIDFFDFQIQAVYFANKIVCDNTAFYNYIRHENSCDSETFTLEKWQRLNLGHANFIYNWINSHEYSEDIRNLYLERIKWLYFYGFNKLAKHDIIDACKILARNMGLHYNCGYDCSNTRKLCRRLYKHHPKTTIFGYIKNIFNARI